MPRLPQTVFAGYLWSAIRYVERNPVRAGMVKKAEDYPWSSASAHCGSESFVKALGDQIGRVLEWRFQGKPRKQNEKG